MVHTYEIYIRKIFTLLLYFSNFISKKLKRILKRAGNRTSLVKKLKAYDKVQFLQTGLVISHNYYFYRCFIKKTVSTNRISTYGLLRKPPLEINFIFNF